MPSSPPGKTAFRGMPVYIGVSLILALLLALSILLAVTIGTVNIPIQDVYRVILYKLFRFDRFGEFSRGPVHDIVWLIRLPRIILAGAVGAGLTICGIVMQAVVRNPLADPYIMGISSGASLGATLAILLGIGASLGGGYVGIVAAAGAFLVSLLVMAAANLGSRASSIKLLLSGIAIGSACSAFTAFITFVTDDRQGIQRITYWLMGSVAAANWTSNLIICLIVISGALFFITQSRTLNLMLLGDEVSITLGTDLHRYRHIYLLVSSLMIGFIVYASGMIGFLGLIIPHFARMFFGPDHRKIIPPALLGGGIFLIWADVLSRIIIPNSELPIGILVSMIGAPCFIYLLFRKTYGFGGGA
ncbi:MAG: iron ABC transporter permease [Treponema sp.]|jgi:iron complex transport system permease protein|nr:iron ABC transporter permease [Treponema sp.]